MRTTLVRLLALSVVLLAASPAWGQAGRYIPVPRPPGGGGGWHPTPHVPLHGGGGDSDFFWFILAAVGMTVVAVVGWHLGQALGGGSRRPAEQAKGPWTFQALAMPQGAPPPMPDLIRSSAEVAAKAGQTTRLMAFLAQRDRPLDPAPLRAWVSTTFGLVQQCWQDRDYGPVKGRLLPGILAEHEALLRAMRRNREVNRLDGLRVDRVEFVHLSCPPDTDGQEFTALITFEACVYFVDERTDAYLRGSRTPARFQEFWVFRRQRDAWLLRAIERSHESDRLEAPNEVAGLTGEQFQNAQECIAV
jgi:hypothetical protein